MKKVILITLAFCVLAAQVLAQGQINSEDISLKAGPTKPGEELSILWLESFVYPKKLSASDRKILLGVRLTSKVKNISVAFDFSQDKVDLSSPDGLEWVSSYKLADSVTTGLHVARFSIHSDKGKIQRTVEFYVQQVDQAKKTQVALKKNDGQAWPLTVAASSYALLKDGSSRNMKEGELIVGVSKAPWYKVVFEDGKEGWVSAADVKEPLSEYSSLGYEAYRSGNYSDAVAYYKNIVAIKPNYVKGHFWLAKSYYKIGDMDSSYQSIMTALKLDERNIDAKLFAAFLARRYYDLALGKFRRARYNESIVAYQKVINLKPDSVISWIQMGQSYQKLGFLSEARAAWQEAFKVNPENKQVRALLNLRDNKLARTNTSKPKRVYRPRFASASSKNMPAVIADDSINLVKSAKTQKGTKISEAVKSVITLTKSLGTPVIEKGWQISKQSGKVLVSYICEQDQGMLESFEWQVDVDTKHIVANNDNAQLIMSRW